MTITTGHFLAVLTAILGDFVEINASGVIQLDTASFVDDEGKPTGETIKKTAFDQVALIGRLKPKGNEPGIFANVHCRTGVPTEGEYARGRTLLKWTIDGELGTIEVQNDPSTGAWGAFIGIGDKRVLLNGEEVVLESSDVDRLDNPGKAWLEFAKGDEGWYWGIDDSVKLHRVLDAALTSIQEGRRVAL